jgi:carbonic anhydrase
MRPGGRKPYRGNDVLKEAAENVKVTHASRITSTSLKKQLATLYQVLNLTESSQDVLATFMGHDIRIHRDYYRLPEGTVEVAKVSKILHLLNTGKITQRLQNFMEIAKH